MKFKKGKSSRKKKIQEREEDAQEINPRKNEEIKKEKELSKKKREKKVYEKTQ